MKRRGFSLIESAIVLGVVGVVISGLWVGASALNQKYKTSETLKTTLLIVNETQNLFAGQTVSADTDITTALINAGIIPSNWVSSGGARSPWNGGVSVLVGSNKIHIAFTQVTKSLCVDLTTRMSGNMRNPTDVTTSFGCDSCCTHGSTSAISLATASSYCSEGGWFSWDFGLRGGPPGGTGPFCR